MILEGFFNAVGALPLLRTEAIGDSVLMLGVIPSREDMAMVLAQAERNSTRCVSIRVAMEAALGRAGPVRTQTTATFVLSSGNRVECRKDIATGPYMLFREYKR